LVVGNFGNLVSESGVIVGNFGKSGVRYFTSDSASLLETY